jgi:hypothetical protein
MRSVLVRACLLGGIALVASPASAQAPGAGERPLAESLQGPARDAFASGRLLFNNNDFAGAATKYQQAYELSKDPRLLFDMAICERNLRAYAKMQGLLEQYERETGAGISAEDKAAVDGALSAIKNLVGTVKVAVSEAAAAVTVDGQVVGTTPLGRPLVVDLGKHTIVATKAGFETTEQTIDVAGGGEMAVTFALVAQRHVAHLVVVAEAVATILIDDKVADRGRFDGNLSPGAHEVRVTEPGKTPYKADLDLRDGETRTVQVTLESERHAAVWPWVVGGAVAAVGLGVGGYFLFKPQDQTTPIPPGKLTAVQFQVWGR